MLVAYNCSGQRSEAREAVKTDGPFLCPACNRDVILKKGTIVIHHFAHKPDSDCAYGQGETRAHMEAKYGIRDLLKSHPKVKTVELEWTLADGCRADVYVEFGSKKLAIELQRSQQTEAETIRRTTRYNDQGVAVLWVAVPAIQKISGNDRKSWGYQTSFVEHYRASAMERFFSGLHLGTYFLWRSDTRTLHKAQLERAIREVDGKGWGADYTTTYKDRRDLHLSKPLAATGLGVKIQQVKPWKHFPERTVAISNSPNEARSQ